MSKIRLAYLVDTIHSATAGTEKQLLGIISRLDRSSFDPHLVSLYRSDWMARNELPCPAFDLGFRGFLKPNLPAVIRRYRRLLRKQQFEIVQTFFEESTFIGYAGAICDPVGHLLISSRRDIGLEDEHPWYHSLYRWLRPAINRKYDAIIANGSQVKQHVVASERVPAAKVYVVHNGVAIPEPRQPIPAILQSDRETVWLGIVANLKPVKRVDLLLSALHQLRQRGLSGSFKTVILGDGILRSQLEERARQLDLTGQVFFAGAVNNVDDYLSNIDIGILCSGREGLSNAILEYLAAGLPVVATAVGDAADMVDHTNGFLVPADDATALAEVLSKLIRDPELRRELGEGSNRKVIAGFTWDRSLQRLEKIYRELYARLTAERGSRTMKPAD